MNDSVSRWKTKHKQNLNPNVAAATEYMMVRSWTTTLDALLWAPTRYTCKQSKRWRRSILTDSRCPNVSMIPVDLDMIKRWDWCHWKSYLLSFPYIYITANLDVVCDLSSFHNTQDLIADVFSSKFPIFQR